MHRNPWTLKRASLALCAVLALTVLSYGLYAGTALSAEDGVEFTDVEAQAREFIGYYHSIELTPEQEAVKKQALTQLAAPCCSDNSAYTCCCPCNMAKSVWGLSNYLIAEKGYDADQVKEAAERWFAFINPKGFSGDVCYRGRCNLPWAEGGCGGMGEEVVF